MLDELSWEDGFAPWDEVPGAPVPGIALNRQLHRSAGGAPDDREIGICSSRARAEAAIRMVRRKPGFRDWPEGFGAGQHAGPAPS